MLVKVVRPDKDEITFSYDPLGRRVSKTYKGKTTKWVWDGNVILHEWCEGDVDTIDTASTTQNDTYSTYSNQLLQNQLSGRTAHAPPAQGTAEKPITWLFEPDSFTPLARMVGDSYQNIVSDHLGTPLAMFDEQGKNTWAMELDIYGQVRALQGKKEDCPFRYPGQYEDSETGLYYNRFRYYDPEVGGYVSQDPIGLLGDNPTIYGYVNDPLICMDLMGLSTTCGNTPKDKAYNFYKNAGWSDARIQSHLKGIDFSKSIDIVTIPKGTNLVQYQIPGANVGNYFAPVGTPGSKLGIYTGGREATIFTTTSDTIALRSTAANVTDDWSVPGWDVLTDGGGTQFFVPNVSSLSP